MSVRGLMVKFARLVYRAFRPAIPVARRYYSAYQNHKIAGIYHAGTVTIKDFCFVERQLRYQPLISVVVPVYNPDPTHFLEMVYSVVNQHYENWELLLVSASSGTALRKTTADCAQIDERIRVIELQENKGISANTNQGLKQAQGEYIALLDHDDLLHPCALHSVAEALMGKNKADLLYTDEDKVSDSGGRFFLPHYKPDWSIDLLRNVNYITHLAVIKRSVVEKLGGLRPVCDGAQDYDLMLRIADEDPVVKHVPKVLYHWRSAKGSTADLVSNKPYVIKAGVRALEDHLKRNKTEAKVVSLSGKPGYYEIQYRPADFSIVIGPVSPSKYVACAGWLEKLAKSLPADTRAELIIGEWYRSIAGSDKAGPLKIKYVPKSRSYWRKASQLINKQAVIIFKIAALPIDGLAIGKLAAVAVNRENSAVSPLITNQTGTIFNAGIIRAAGSPIKLFEGYQYGKNTFFGDTDWVRDVSDLTPDIVAFKSDLFKKLIRDSESSFGRAATVGDWAAGSAKLIYIVWAHSVFEYLGPLKFTLNNHYHRVQQLRFIPSEIVHIDNWGEKYERDES